MATSSNNNITMQQHHFFQLRPQPRIGSSRQYFRFGSPSGLMDISEIMGRSYDVVIFAASSSVGRFLVEEMALVVDKYYSSCSQQKLLPMSNSFGVKESRDPSQFAQTRRRSVPRHVNDIKWAIAGRSAANLSETLNRVELNTGIKGLSAQVPVILADLNHHKSLLDMCSKTDLIINCAGPYSIDGEVVIKACLKSKTNYIDLSHETNFIESVYQRYSTEAIKKGVYIINGCGFQSMSAEMGLNFTKLVVDGQIEEMKIILELSDTKALIRAADGNGKTKPSGIISWGMWYSLLIEQAQEIFMTKRMKNSKSTAIPVTLAQRVESPIRDIVEFRSERIFPWLQLINEYGFGYCLPVNSLTSEEAQLIRGEMNSLECREQNLNSTKNWKPIRYTSFISVRSFCQVIIILIWLLVFKISVKFCLFRTLMKAFPSIFSLGCVTNNGKELDRDSLSHIKFCQTFLVYGTREDDPIEASDGRRDQNSVRKRERLLVCRVVGPEPNHVATATYATQAALTFILEKDHLPKDGGVMTPGAAFSETNIIHRLRRRNMKFEVMKNA